MKNIEKIAGLIIVSVVISVACQRGPHKETWGAGKPKKTLDEKKK